MVIGTARVVLHIGSAQSLKEKRAVVKSVLAQVRRQFSVSAAEIESQDKWQLAVLGLACVSSDAAHADEVVAKAVRAISAMNGEAELLDYATEIVHVL